MAELNVVKSDPPADADVEEHRRQTEIPGTERPTDAELDKLAVRYVSTREKRTELQDKEKELKAKMSARMDAIAAETGQACDYYEFRDGERKRKIERERGKEKLTVSIVDEDE